MPTHSNTDPTRNVSNRTFIRAVAAGLTAAGGQLEPAVPVCCTTTGDRGISKVSTGPSSDITAKKKLSTMKVMI